jgi:hypothetical protein
VGVVFEASHAVHREWRLIFDNSIEDMIDSITYELKYTVNNKQPHHSILLQQVQSDYNTVTFP